MKVKFVSYLRVSTTEQGRSGLGLEAQQAAIAQHLQSCGGELIAEFPEVESGKSDLNRPKLAEALALCKKMKAILIIAKLDRLSRNLAFVANLMESGAEFVACDMPYANKLTIHIMFAVAEAERDFIAARTQASMDRIKAQLAAGQVRIGKKSGKPYTKLGNQKNWQEALEKANRARNPNRPAPETVELIQDLRAKGLTLRAIAARLNAMDLLTPKTRRYPKGCIWYACTVRTVLRSAPDRPLAVAA